MNTVNDQGTSGSICAETVPFEMSLKTKIKNAAMALKIINQRGFHESAVLQRMVAEDLNALTEALRENARR